MSWHLVRRRRSANEVTGQREVCGAARARSVAGRSSGCLRYIKIIRPQGWHALSFPSLSPVAQQEHQAGRSRAGVAIGPLPTDRDPFRRECVGPGPNQSTRCVGVLHSFFFFPVDEEAVHFNFGCSGLEKAQPWPLSFSCDPPPRPSSTTVPVQRLGHPQHRSASL